MLEKTGASLEIVTPECVEFSLPLAGPFLRFLALVIDLACIAVMLSLFGLVSNLIAPVWPRLFSAASILIYFCVITGYGMAAEWLWRGQTVGKRVVGLRVVDERGLRLKFSQVALRNLLRAVDSLPICYAAGGISCFFTPKHQRLGDIAAGTVVIRHLQPQPLNRLLLAAPLETDKYNSFRTYPYLEARLRQRVTPEEAEIALQSLIRRDEFEPAERTRLFRELAQHYRGMVQFPEDATFALSDEQYVRNVVDTMFRPRAATKPHATAKRTAPQTAQDL